MTRPEPRFALNQSIAPTLSLADFLALATSLGIDAVEIRNDLPGTAIADGTPPVEVRRLAEAAGVSILSINALQRFDDWSGQRPTEALALADYAAACGARALVLVPTNDGRRPDGLLPALEGLRPLLQTRGLAGLIEPLGFATCLLRRKSDAIAAIAAVGGETVFGLVHDTFHHVLAGEAAFFPRETALVHISGVDDPARAIADMRDPDRGLVTDADRLATLFQLRALAAGGYAGPLSFEPLAPAVQAVAGPAAAIRASMDRVRDALRTASIRAPASL